MGENSTVGTSRTSCTGNRPGGGGAAVERLSMAGLGESPLLGMFNSRGLSQHKNKKVIKKGLQEERLLQG